MTANPQNTNEKSRSVKKYIILALLLLIICAIVTYFWGVLYFLNSPINPPLEIVEATPTLIAEESPTETSLFCSETGSMLLIVLGTDLPETDFPKGADAIRFVELDFSNQEISILAIPRDLWISSFALTLQGYDAERLGQTYFIGKNLATESEDEVRLGTSVLTQTFYDNFGLFPDHYVTLNMEAFAEMVDSIGGVGVNIPEDFNGARFSFLVGEQELSGDMLMDYSRTFLVGTEWDRLTRQDLVLKALKEKMISASIIAEIPSLLSQFDDIVTTDLTPQQFINLGCMLQNISDEDIHFFEISPDMVSFDSNGHMLPDRGKIITFINDLFGE